MSRFIALMVLIILVMSCAMVADDNPKAEIFGGYQYFRLNPGVSGVDSINMNGWDASLSGYFTKHIGLSGDFSGAYASPSGVSLKAHTFMFGPIVRFPGERITPFVHALFGGVHGSASAGGFGGGETDFAWAAGGGVDVNLNHRFAVRLAQADFLQTRIGGDSQNNFRYSAGIVFKF